jgi:NTP pyrophosphatase (non-canonical NTP hydrolase)
MEKIIFTEEQQNVLEDAIRIYSTESQLRQTNEELTECSLAILKLERAKDNNLHLGEIYKREEELMGEIADVLIMINQLLLVFDPVQIQQMINFKLRRQRKRIDERIEQTTK